MDQYGKPVRIDTVLDDYDRVVDMATIYESVKSGELVSHARHRSWIDEGSVGSYVDTGVGISIGRRTSRQYLRIYDKNLESKGECDAIRWELESHDEAAVAMVARLVLDDWSTVIASKLVSFVDFREIDSDSNTTRRTRVAWYEQLVSGARKAVGYIWTVPRTALDTLNWVKRQVAPSLAMLMSVSSGSLNWFDDVVRDGRRRLKSKHFRMIDEGMPDGGTESEWDRALKGMDRLGIIG